MDDRPQSKQVGAADAWALIGAMVALLGLFSMFLDAVESANAMRNLIVGLGGQGPGHAGHGRLLRLDWVTFWLGPALGAGLFGVLIVLLLRWLRSEDRGPHRVGTPGSAGLLLVAVLFLGAGLAHLTIGLMADLPEINRAIASLPPAPAGHRPGAP